MTQRLAQLDQNRPTDHDLSNSTSEDPFARAVFDVGQARYREFIDGVNAYRAHPAARAMPALPTAWQEGATVLLDGAPDASPAAQPVILVPSLINKGYILDFMPHRSLVRDLARQGFHPYLMEWGTPGEVELAFSLDDYVAGRLFRAFDYIRARSASAVAVIGYCMGGLMALALAAHRADQVSALALLATPFDFHAREDDDVGADADPSARARAVGAAVNPAYLGAGTSVPIDALQGFFAALDPMRVPNKFRAFAKMDPTSSTARGFVLLEDWLNDGVPLAGPVAHDCFVGWYAQNRPACNQWRIGGRVVDPALVQAPSLLMVPNGDYIVPPGSASALGAVLPGAQVRRIKAGHVGMVAGSRAVTSVYRPLGRWLFKVSGNSKPNR